MKQLELRFVNQENRLVTLSLEKPIEPVDPQLIQDTMAVIIASGAFTSTGGAIVDKHSARLVERHVEEIEI
ncbi:Protein of unknown function [Amphibacillus marinus]|uniref:DUF2922 domain-containing protein n=1 Tax=Amphibacillus marinus TaxID=872970 RepID=A0A1H8IFM6_9BACI|nr:DUF2922 domain-containing protein [Amphibacillus marinus]SEN67483.1 Protein of unknown function [Amphibacillus marinus]